MSASAIMTLAARLPLRIRAVEWTDPTLIVAGDDWSLSLTCPWRATTPQGIAFGWSIADVEDRAWEFVGAEIVRITRQASETYVDPVLVLSNGISLEVFSDSELDPWSLRVGEITIVGPLTREDWT